MNFILLQYLWKRFKMWLSESLLVGCNQYFLTWGGESKSSEFLSACEIYTDFLNIPILVVITTLHVRNTFYSFVLLLLLLKFGVLLFFFFFC